MSACEDFIRLQTLRIVQNPYGLAPQACSIVCVRAQQNIVKTNAESISGGVLQKLAVVSIRNFSRILRYLKQQRGAKKACRGQRNVKDLNYLYH